MEKGWRKGGGRVGGRAGGRAGGSVRGGWELGKVGGRKSWIERLKKKTDKYFGKLTNTGGNYKEKVRQCEKRKGKKLQEKERN